MVSCTGTHHVEHHSPSARNLEGQRSRAKLRKQQQPVQTPFETLRTTRAIAAIRCQDRYVEHWMHLCRVTARQSDRFGVVPRKRRARPIAQDRASTGKTKYDHLARHPALARSTSSSSTVCKSFRCGRAARTGSDQSQSADRIHFEAYSRNPRPALPAVTLGPIPENLGEGCVEAQVFYRRKPKDGASRLVWQFSQRKCGRKSAV